MMTNSQMELLNRKLTEILNVNKIEVIDSNSIRIRDRILQLSNPNQTEVISSRTTSSR